MNKLEFCPTCPAKGSCVGKVRSWAEVFEMADTSAGKPLIKITFTDSDGLHTDLTTAVAFVDKTKGEELAKRLENRVEQCNGSGTALCPAFNTEVLRHLAQIVMPAPGSAVD